jgi:hypothetical protein
VVDIDRELLSIATRLRTGGPMRLLSVISVVFISACGGSNAPIPTASGVPIIPLVAGNWTGTLTQVQATGGPECLAELQQSTGVVDRFVLSVTQTGATLSAAGNDEDIPDSCSYVGTAGNTDAFALQASSCQPAVRTLNCGGTARDLYRIQPQIAGTVTGNTISATSSVSWSVFPVGTTIGSLGVVSITATISLSR